MTFPSVTTSPSPAQPQQQEEQQTNSRSASSSTKLNSTTTKEFDITSDTSAAVTHEDVDFVRTLRPSNHSSNTRIRSCVVDNVIMSSKGTLRGIGVVALLIALMAAYTYQDAIFAGFESFLDWVQKNPMQGAVYYVLIYAVSAVFCVPAVILTIGSGFIFTSIYGSGLGLLVACCVDFIGATAGALASFYTCRLLFFAWVQDWAQSFEKWQVAEKLIQVACVSVPVYVYLYK